MKKEMKTAEIISVKDASFVNPLGTVLSGVTRSGAPLNLAGSGERWKVLFRCEDDSLFEATIGGLHRKVSYAAGSKGILTVKGNDLVSWEPFQGGENSEESLRAVRKKKRMIKFAAIGVAALLLLAAAVQLLVYFGSRERVTRVLESEDGSRVEVTVNKDRRMQVRTQGTHFIVISFRNVLYRVEIPTIIEGNLERQEKQRQTEDPGSGVLDDETLYGLRDGIDGQIFQVISPAPEKILIGQVYPGMCPVRISAEGDKANISALLRKVSFKQLP